MTHPTSHAAQGRIDLDSLTRYGWIEDTSLGMVDLRAKKDGNYVRFTDVESLLARNAACAAPAASEQSGAAYTDVVASLREYASNSGYSHNDYADTMRQAANCIESLRAMAWNYAVPTVSAPAGLTEREAFIWNLGHSAGRGDDQALAASPAPETAQADDGPLSPLRYAVRQMARALADGEWADLLTPDHDAAELEQQIGKLIERAHAQQDAAPAEIKTWRKAIEIARRGAPDTGWGKDWDDALEAFDRFFATSAISPSAATGKAAADNEDEVAKLLNVIDEMSNVHNCGVTANAVEKLRKVLATSAADAKDAEPVISSYDIEKVKSLKFKFVDSLIHNGIQYRTCGAISAALNEIIADSEAAAIAASQKGTEA